MKSGTVSQFASLVVAALLGAAGTYAAMAPSESDASTVAQANLLPAQPPASQEARQTMLFETTMEDVLGRVVTIREFERAPGTGSTPHRHPGSHTFGYVLEGTYEVQVGDGPLRSLGPGETFYETPNALHAVSRNGSDTERVRYLVIQVSDPTKPATVQEP